MPSVASRSSAVVVPSVSAKVAWHEERPGSRRKGARRKEEGEQERIRRKDDRPFMFFRVPPSSSPTPPPAGQVTWLQCEADKVSILHASVCPRPRWRPWRTSRSVSS